MKRRRSFTIDQKMKIILDYERMKENKSKSQIAEELGIKRTSLLTILENKDIINSNCEKNEVNKKISHFKNSNFQELYKCLLYWVNNMNDNPKTGVMVNNNSIDYAIGVFKNLLHIKKEISPSFVQRWRNRYAVKSYTISGESESCDVRSYKNWKQSTLNFILEKYELCNIFNLDEAGF
jgi:hypothetical protein